MIDGHGSPESQLYAETVQTLYNVAYSLKMGIIKPNTPEKSFVVPPLEGLWYMDDMTKWSDNKDEWKWAFLLLLPSLLGVGIFVAIPVIASFGLSFAHWNMLSPPKWVGLSNYLDLFREPLFWQVMKN